MLTLSWSETDMKVKDESDRRMRSALSRHESDHRGLAQRLSRLNWDEMKQQERQTSPGCGRRASREPTYFWRSCEIK